MCKEDEHACHIPGFLEQRVKDIENLFTGATGEGWEFEVLQLTPGSLDARVRQISLPQVTISWYDYGAGLHMREFHRKDAVFLTFLLDASAPAKWYGKEVGANEALLYLPRHEQDYVLAPATHSLGFMIQHSALRAMGLRFEPTPFHELVQADRDRVVALARTITTQVHNGGIQNNDQMLVLQERLLLGLAKVLAPWVMAKSERSGNDFAPGRSFQLIDQARRYMLALEPAQKLNVPAMVSHLGTSSRTLYRAFTRYLGIGPYEYFTLLRMQIFRQNLRSSGAYHGAITDAAISAGFTHMGRFSRMYREYYGETPKQTLRRWT